MYGRMDGWGFTVAGWVWPLETGPWVWIVTCCMWWFCCNVTHCQIINWKFCLRGPIMNLCCKFNPNPSTTFWVILCINKRTNKPINQQNDFVKEQNTWKALLTLLSKHITKKTDAKWKFDKIPSDTIVVIRQWIEMCDSVKNKLTLFCYCVNVHRNKRTCIYTVLQTSANWALLENRTTPFNATNHFCTKYTVTGKNGPPKHVKITLWMENVSDYFSLYHEMPSICNVHVKFHDN